MQLCQVNNEMAAIQLDFDHLLRLRLAVARYGEMDVARWWNTKGVLGKVGELALNRGFPRSHFFAQARVVFAVAADRCRKIFDPPDAVTLWKLPAGLEVDLNSRWAEWNEASADWQPFFLQLQLVQAGDLIGTFEDLKLIRQNVAEEARKLRRAGDNRAAPLPGTRTLDQTTLSLLAAGFFRGEPGAPAIPYARIANA